MSAAVTARNDSTSTTPKPFSEDGLPLLLSAEVAARFCGTSLRTWRSWDSAGRIPSPIHIGRSLFWRRDELRRWIDAGCPARTYWKLRC